MGSGGVATITKMLSSRDQGVHLEALKTLVPLLKSAEALREFRLHGVWRPLLAR